MNEKCKMKILHVTTISNAVNEFLLPHIRMLIDEGHQVDVAFNIVQKVKSEIKELGCRIHEVPFQRSPLSKDNVKAYKTLKKIILENNYDLVHAHTPVASFITRFTARNIPSLKVFYTAHGFHFYKGAPFKNWLLYFPLEWWMSKYTDVLITINKEDYQLALKRFKTVVYRIHGVGVKTERYFPYSENEKIKIRSELGYTKKDFILLCTGELNKNKNQGILIKTVAQITKEIPDIKLLLAGKGPMKKNLEELVHNLGLSENVVFLGYRTDLPKFVNICDIAVSASIREGLPLTIMEAIFCGKPVVASLNRGHCELVSNGVTGYLVEPRDADGFASRILELKNNPLLMKEMGEKARDTAGIYKSENVLRELKEVYKMVLQ